MNEKDTNYHEAFQVITTQLTPLVEGVGYALTSARPMEDGIRTGYVMPIFKTEYPRFHLLFIVRSSLNLSITNLHLDKKPHETPIEMDKLWNEYELGLLKEEIQRIRNELSKSTTDKDSMFLDRKMYYLSRSLGESNFF